MTERGETAVKPLVQPGMAATPALSGGGPRVAPVPSFQIVEKATREHRVALAGAVCPTSADNAACKLPVSVTLFFDGTGNNLKVDLPTLEHSNVARMFQAHPRNDPIRGLFAYYVPGIGTPFEDIKDRGAGPIPVLTSLLDVRPSDINMGTGRLGQARLAWAFERVQEALTQRKCAEVTKLTLSVFGFSRGAALARAFLQQLTSPRGYWCKTVGNELRWKRGNILVEVNFVGLWDTVASVGIPMSGSTILSTRSERQQAWWKDAMGAAVNPVISIPMPFFRLPQVALGDVLREKFGLGEKLTVKDLAFGDGKLDVSPGSMDGHESWGGQMALDGSFHKKCVHMIAAHEQRASFPVDSVSKGSAAPAKTIEMVFPGVHSDVGGGYRPGEQGRGGAAAEAGVRNSAQDALKLSQITLHEMYWQAVEAGVPLLPYGDKDLWEPQNVQDFQISPALVDMFNHYQAQVKTTGGSLGDVMLAHTKLLFKWRFAAIRRDRQTYGDRTPQGRGADRKRMGENEIVFKMDELALDKELAPKRARRHELESQVASMGLQRAAVPLSMRAKVEQEQKAVLAELKRLDIDILNLEARRASLPGRDGAYIAAMARFDKELLEDVSQLYIVVTAKPEERKRLRPHYKNLLEAYEDEFVHNKGLRDEKVLAFFENHIHDSLSAFDKDSTLASDPRVVYVGGSDKA